MFSAARVPFAVCPGARCAVENGPTSGALPGIRVVEAASGSRGPYLAQLLAEHGAQVLKLQPPAGDPFRASPGFSAVNRSKHSAVLHIGDLDARRRLLALLHDADLFIHDLPAGERALLRLDRESLA